MNALLDAVHTTAGQFDVPGAAVGILVDGRKDTASFGVTNVDHPVPIDETTVFHLASVTKTFTATALMRLAAEGRVDLDAPVRKYVPELRLVDDDAAARITVSNLLNHTAGLDWNLIHTDGRDASIEGFVTAMVDLPQIAEPGTRASYSQAGYNLAGRVIEKVTGESYERAVASLLLEPLGLTDTVFDLNDVLIRKFAVGHTGDEGVLRPARPWKQSNGNNPGGGAASTVDDLLRWAQFHLGDGDGVLPVEALRRMREQTVELRASSLGDGFGVCWFLRTVGGVETVGHGGSGAGQFAELLLVPERNFAVVSLANSGPDGYLFNQAIVRWALEHYLGVVEEEPEPLPYDAARSEEVAGRYEIDAMNIDIATDGSRLTLSAAIKPEIRAASDDEMPPDYPPATIAFLPDVTDEYVVVDGGLAGQRGYFTRDETGAVIGVDLAGRLFSRS
ncbi:serine hydrolase domain-containing protein [Cryptosporangium sp. NPDC048952]|uniref:serine hydrolase domain-containing protein n=1 Tax=Cryptosporangium sp. NPDC048952 TaxID=3363961 RepID=UPI00370F9E6B